MIRLVCQCLRQINSAFNDLKQLSIAELSKQLPFPLMDGINRYLSSSF